MTEGITGLFRPWHVDGAFDLKDGPHCLALPMWDLDGRIALAVRHVAVGRDIVAKQEERIAKGMADSGSLERLATFRQSLAIFEQDLARLLKEGRQVMAREVAIGSAYFRLGKL